MSLDDGLLDHAIWVTNSHNGGGSYAGGSWKIVVHEIQGSSNPGLIVGHPAPPHLWYTPATRVLYQTVPLTRSAFALEHRSGDPETNKCRALQVEVAGYSSASADEPQQWLDNLAEDVIVPLCQFVARQGGQIDLTQFSSGFVYSGAAYYTSVNRMSWERWLSFPGVTGHAWTPGNVHWDPGAMDLGRVATHSAIVIGGLLENVPQSPGGIDVAEAMFTKRPVPFDDPGTPGSTDDAYDHYWLPAGAQILVASTHPDSSFTSVLYGPGFTREDINAVVRGVAWNAAVVYTTRQPGQHTIVVQQGMPVRVWAVY